MVAAFCHMPVRTVGNEEYPERDSKVMLRRKLFLILGSLVALLLVAAVGAILILQSVLVDLSHINEEAINCSNASTQFMHTLDLINLEVKRLNLDDPDLNLDTVSLQRAVDVLGAQGHRLAEPFHKLGPSLSELHQRIEAVILTLAAQVETVMADSSPEEVTAGLNDIQTEVTILSLHMEEYVRLARRHTELDNGRLVSKFRTIMLGLGLIFLVLINGSILALINAASMILQPVNALIDGSRRLAREEFDHRLNLDRHDEFGELAMSFDHLAEQLQRNEQRKIETLQQVSRALNHDINNALSVIDLQFKVMDKTRPDQYDQKKPLQQIHEMLKRIGKTVDALKRVRRIVLTDYVSGMKMLDLERSVEEEPSKPQIETRPMTEIRAK